MSKDSFVIHPSGKHENGATLPFEKPVALHAPLVSILIPCVGMLEYTKLCVPSLLKHTRQPFELLFLDIGSLDGTAEYLAGLTTVQPLIRVEVLRTPTDLGIKEVVREALQRARGEYLVLLNNDTVVTNGWLNQLVGLANMGENIGLVGPMSNYAALGQLVEEIPYRIGPKKVPRWEGRHGASEVLVDVEEVNAFALEHREKNRGKWIEIDRLGGFCVLIKRDALKRMEVHDLAKWSDLSLFDTDILSSKARQAGYALAVCRDLFVHHFGTRTFAHGAAAPPAHGQTQESAVRTSPA